MASRQLTHTRSVDVKRAADVAKATELSQRFNGWTVWSSRDGKARVATRTGNPVDPNDGTWAASLVADDWDELELQLKAQAQADALRTYEVPA